MGCPVERKACIKQSSEQHQVVLWMQNDVQEKAKLHAGVEYRYSHRGCISDSGSHNHNPVVRNKTKQVKVKDNGKLCRIE